jgi:hypothetical protein
MKTKVLERNEPQSLRGPMVRGAVMVAVLALAGGSSTLRAQSAVSPASAVTIAITPQDSRTSPVKGSDTNFDPVNQVFLIVSTCYNTFSCPPGLGQVYGMFYNLGGTPQGPAFSIAGDGDGHFPRARYSPHVNGGTGGFLVTWSEEFSGGNNFVRSRVIAYSGGVGVPVGPIQTLNGAGSYSWVEAGAAIGYSPTSQRFLVAWRTYPTVGIGPYLAARLTDINGAPVGEVIRLSSALGRDPGIAWDSHTDRFGVSFAAENAAGSVGWMAFARVSPADGSFQRESFPALVGYAYITDIDYNPDTQRFVMTWHQQPGGSPEVRVAEMATDLSTVTSGLISRLLPGYDALSIARNPVSRTFSLASINFNDEIVAIELNQRGFRTSPLTVMAPAVVGRYPRISAGTGAPRWSITFSDGFRALKTVTVQTSSTNGGDPGSYEAGSAPAPSPTPTPTPTPTPDPTACTSVQPGSDWTCVNGNWLPPGSEPAPAPTPAPTPTPSPVTCTSPQPGSDWVCSNGNWLPPGTFVGGGGGGGTGCTTTQPVSGWVCVNGGWVPPELAPGGGGGGGGTGCASPQPMSNWVCVNGNWLPPDLAPGGGGSTNSSGCTTVQPVSNWVCVNGDWVPPDLAPGGGGGSTSGGCTTVQPGSNWVCVNGAWLPAEVAPLPGPGGCTTVQPGADWVCVNGNWLPPGTGSGSSCTTVQPGPGWTCVNGDWRPPSEAEPEHVMALDQRAPDRQLPASITRRTFAAIAPRSTT